MQVHVDVVTICYLKNNIFFFLFFLHTLSTVISCRCVWVAIFLFASFSSSFYRAPLILNISCVTGNVVTVLHFVPLSLSRFMCKCIMCWVNLSTSSMINEFTWLFLSLSTFLFFRRLLLLRACYSSLRLTLILPQNIRKMIAKWFVIIYHTCNCVQNSETCSLLIIHLTHSSALFAGTNLFLSLSLPIDTLVSFIFFLSILTHFHCHLASSVCCCYCCCCCYRCCCNCREMNHAETREKMKKMMVVDLTCFDLFDCVLYSMMMMMKKS